MTSAGNHWDREELFLDGGQYYAAILKDISAAVSTIDAEIYIFRIDVIGRKISEALVAAADRGVRVRLLIDSVGSAYSASAVATFFKSSRVELRFYRRFFARGWLPSPWRLNRRNHRKNWIFDSKAAYVGSSNVDDCHVPKVGGGGGWKDVCVRVEGEGISVLEDSFEVAWTKPSPVPGQGRRAKARELIDSDEGHDGDLVHLNDTIPRRRSLRIENRKRLYRSRRRVWLANAYFAPHQRFVRTLRNVARRGVDVRVLVPRHSDVFFMPLLTFSYYKFLLKGGVKLYEYLPSVYHAKVRVVDEHMSIGSSNLDYRSVFYNLESDVQLTHVDTRLALESDLLRDFANAEPITLQTIRLKPWYLRVAATLLSLLRYWV